MLNRYLRKSINRKHLAVRIASPCRNNDTSLVCVPSSYRWMGIFFLHFNPSRIASIYAVVTMAIMSRFLLASLRFISSRLNPLVFICLNRHSIFQRCAYSLAALAAFVKVVKKITPHSKTYTTLAKSLPKSLRTIVQRNCNKIMSGIALLFFAAFEIRYPCFELRFPGFSCF
jgi:hypothetical protein